MAVAFESVGALAAAAGTGGGATALTITAPACAADDILIAVILSKSNTTISPPDGTWTSVVAVNNTSVQRCSIWWKKAIASNGSFIFTRASEGINWYGVISAWRGANTASPIDATSPSTSPNASSDTVTYATFDPAGTTGIVIAIGVYNEDNTTAGSISGTNPALVNRWDLESGTGADGSIFGYEGSSDGTATGARSHTTTSAADAINIGVLFGMKPAVDTTVTPPTGSVSTTSYSPTIAVSNNQLVTVPVKALATATFIASIILGTVIVPSTSALASTTYAPTITVGGAGETVTPPTLSLILSEFVPTITITENVLVTVPVSGLTATSFIPVISVSDNKIVVPTVLPLGLITDIPSIVLGTVITPDIGIVGLTSYIPTITVVGNTNVIPPTADLSLTIFAPEVDVLYYTLCGIPFLYTSANWGTADFYLEVYMRATAGTVYAQLYDLTSEGSAMQVSTNETSFTLVRSGAITLTNGHTYRLRVGKVDTDAGEIVGGKLVIY